MKRFPVNNTDTPEVGKGHCPGTLRPRGVLIILVRCQVNKEKTVQSQRNQKHIINSRPTTKPHNNSHYNDICSKTILFGDVSVKVFK